MRVPAPASSFGSFGTYVAYALYSPLYLAGPIVTFNDYVSQSTHRAGSIRARRTMLYAVRFGLTVLCMEFLLHTIYVVAISKLADDKEAGAGSWAAAYTPFQLAMLAYFNLHIIWLKLLIPWRFFRLWALVDGVDPPENVARCMSNNYSALAFWRGWHRSFNRWIVRYIYVPLGGSRGGRNGNPTNTTTAAAGGRPSKTMGSKPPGKQVSVYSLSSLLRPLRPLLNMAAVFTFVALWHDINLRLLAWGWLVVLFVAPELLATYLFPATSPYWRSRPTAYRVLCGCGAVVNILMMMAANLVGFAVGLDGLLALVGGLVDAGLRGALFMLAACACLFVGVQVMFEHREAEKRRGVRMKC